MRLPIAIFFFFNDTATTEIYTLSLHDALPISPLSPTRPTTSSAFTAKSTRFNAATGPKVFVICRISTRAGTATPRSEEHTSELQSQSNLVCRLLLEKKNKENNRISPRTIQFTH